MMVLAQIDLMVELPDEQQHYRYGNRGQKYLRLGVVAQEPAMGVFLVAPPDASIAFRGGAGDPFVAPLGHFRRAERAVKATAPATDRCGPGHFAEACCGPPMTIASGRTVRFAAHRQGFVDPAQPGVIHYECEGCGATWSETEERRRSR